MAGRLVLGFALALLPVVAAQGGSPPSSYPHDYSNKPTSPLGPSWQNYFKVNTQLPGVNFPLKSSYAGNLAVNRPNHPNNTLFFWGFEKTTGSLALNTPANRAPWTIWLNGGPGSSSFYGFFFENGPIRIQSDGSIVKNQYSWDGLSDIFWIDQPVGVGYSTADSDGYVPDQDQIGRDFMGFLENLVKVFPGLKNRPLVLAGESYAGMYIPYILKAYFGMSNPPVKVDKIMIGDPTITSGVVFNLLPTLSVIETFPQLIGYDPEVYKYFKQQSHLCNYDVNLTYPQTGGLIPDVPVRQPRDREIPWLSMQTFTKAQFFRTLAKRHEDSIADGLTKRDRLVERDTWKRSVAGRPTDSIDPWYGCFVWDAVLDYAVNFTYPWNEDAGLNVYDVADALWPEPNHDAAPFMNNPQVRAALHAPQSKDWALQFPFVFGTAGRNDPSPFSMTFMSELATNASAKNVGIVLASGNNDMLIAHLSTEIAIQNTTFGGIQGFTKKPSTPWNDDSGKFAGIVHQERGWTYALFYGTGHMIPSGVPQAAYKFFRDWVLGNSPIGKVAGNSVIGGTDDRFKGQNIPAGPEIYLGAGVTQSTYIAPQATRAAWDSFLRTETANRYGARTAPTPAPGGPPRPPTGPGGPPGPTPTRHHRALRDVSES